MLHHYYIFCNVIVVMTNENTRLNHSDVKLLFIRLWISTINKGVRVCSIGIFSRGRLGDYITFWYPVIPAFHILNASSLATYLHIDGSYWYISGAIVNPLMYLSCLMLWYETMSCQNPLWYRIKRTSIYWNHHRWKNYKDLLLISKCTTYI